VTAGPAAAEAAAIAAAVEHVPGVARLSGGPVGAVATYGPGRRVVGVRRHGDRLELHVVASSTTMPIPSLSDRIRRQVHDLFPEISSVDVFVDDFDQEGTA
jgi:hypothetical protein